MFNWDIRKRLEKDFLQLIQYMGHTWSNLLMICCPFFSRRRTFRARDMHALILIFCWLHTIDIKQAHAMHVIPRDLHSGHRMASNTMQFSIEASSSRQKKKRRSCNSVCIAPVKFTFGTLKLVALIAAKVKKKYSSLPHHYCNIWYLSMFYE